MNRPALVGILNVTPDSFSDGYADAAEALRQFDRLVADGADIIDIGAESTRPGAAPLTPQQEWQRLAPVLEKVANRHREVRISLDTRHYETASRGLEAGSVIINDVAGLSDPLMLELLAGYDNDIIAMHSLGVPANPVQTLPDNADPVQVVLTWKTELLQRADAHGIAPERLIFDPGLGFGKTAGQSRALVAHAAQLVATGGRWLYGHSRKSFLAGGETLAPSARDGLTHEVSVQLAQAGVHYLRVHDIAGHVALLGR